MDASYATFFFLAGTAIGSFLNVVILRYNTGLRIGKSRSICFSCGKKLHWYELIPVLSYLFLGGKCSACKSRLSWQYPLVEVFTGILFLAVYLQQYGFLYTSYLVLVFSILVVILVYDLKHKIIPDGLVYAFIFLGFLNVVVMYQSEGRNFTEGVKTLIQYPGIFDLLSGPLLFLPFFLMWFLSRGRWMGFGDAKLALGIGWFMGISQGISSIILGFWIGAAVSLLLLTLSKFQNTHILRPLLWYFGGKQLTIKSEVPFAPFLIAGMWIVFFTHISIINLQYFFGA